MAKINLAQESSTPSNPSAGANRLYFKGDDKLYKLNSAGSEEEIGAGDVTPYRIAVTVASNNLTLALKDKDGNDPSAGSPVKVQIGDTVREVTAALSVTKNAGTNWCNAGSAELATKEIDYFAYLGYNATDGVVIGFSRIPFARVYSNFSATTTNEKYAAISTITNAAAGDAYTVIGRFAATLSAGAGFTWTVPTFTAENLIHQPFYETRILSWTPVWTNLTIGNGTHTATYKIHERAFKFNIFIEFGSTTSMGSAPFHSHLFSIRQIPNHACFAEDTFTAFHPAMWVGGYLYAMVTSSTYASLATFSATIPFTWTTQDKIHISVSDFII